MTDDEVNAGVGRMAHDYAETRRKIACLRNRIASHHGAVLTLLTTVGEAQTVGYGALQHACSGVDWDALTADADALAAMGKERERLEHCLREAGLGELVK